jgi:hypothetical protein
MCLRTLISVRHPSGYKRSSGLVRMSIPPGRTLTPIPFRLSYLERTPPRCCSHVIGYRQRTPTSGAAVRPSAGRGVLPLADRGRLGSRGAPPLHIPVVSARSPEYKTRCGKQPPTIPQVSPAWGEMMPPFEGVRRAYPSGAPFPFGVGCSVTDSRAPFSFGGGRDERRTRIFAEER